MATDAPLLVAPGTPTVTGRASVEAGGAEHADNAGTNKSAAHLSATVYLKDIH